VVLDIAYEESGPGDGVPVTLAASGMFGGVNLKP
jgi:hypothetical protein